MATIGHPLSDLCNFTTPFYTATVVGTNAQAAFLPGATAGLPDAKEIVRWYTEVSGYDPAAELAWGMAFNIFRSAAVCQGIAARIAQRQANSDVAKKYADTRVPLAEFAWELTAVARSGRAKL